MKTDLQILQHELALYDRVITHLHTIQRKSFLQYAIGIGQYVVKEFFEGDFHALHDKAHDKGASFQRFLVERKEELGELDLSATTLRTYVSAAEVAQGLPEHVAAQLGLVHLRQLSAVRDAPTREKMAHDAAHLHWNRGQIDIAVNDWKKAQRQGTEKRGPKPRPAVLRAASDAHAAVKRLHKLHGAAANLDVAHRVVLLGELAAMRKILDGLG